MSGGSLKRKFIGQKYHKQAKYGTYFNSFETNLWEEKPK